MKSGQPLSAHCEDNWADSLTVFIGVYFLGSGLVLLIADAVFAVHNGRFSVISPYSLSIGRWLFLAGWVGSLLAYVGYPTRLFCRISVVMLSLLFATGAVSVWVLAR